MKIVLFALLLLFGFRSCHVRHDHSKQMPQIRVPVDSTQKNDVATEDRDWADEDLVEIPEESEPLTTLPGETQDELDRMMRGEE